MEIDSDLATSFAQIKGPVEVCNEDIRNNSQDFLEEF